MDANVIAAMARWPDVPNAYGWLSLTESGQWRLHPRGDAWQPEGGASSHDAAGHTPGEGITSPQILQFINRNYTCDAHGQWFFQNGPQKVYVRLDGAPYILHTVGEGHAGTLGLRTHSGLDVKTVTAWVLDEAGKLYAQTEHGAGLVAGRDLASVLDGIYTPQGRAILDVLEQENTTLPIEVSAIFACTAVLFKACAAQAVEQELGFVRYPRPTTS